MRITIKAPNGKEIILNGPDGASKEEIQSMAMKAKERAIQLPEFQASESKPSPMSTQQAVEMQRYIPTSPVPAPGTVPPGAYEMMQGRDPGVFKAANEMGEAVATGLAESGANPYLAAGVGTAMQMSPDLALGAIPGAEAARPAAQGIQTGAKASIVGAKMGIKKVVQRVFGKGAKRVGNETDVAIGELKRTKDLFKKGSLTRQTYEKMAEGITNQLKGVKTNYVEMIQDLKQTRTQLGRQIQTAEEAFGLGLKDTQLIEKVTSNTKLSQSYASRLIKLGDRTADQLKSYGSDTLQKAKKMTEALIRSGSLDDTTRALLKRSNTKIGQAIPETAKLRSELGTVYKQLEALPGRYKTQVADMTRRLNKYRGRIKQLKESDKISIKRVEEEIAEVAYEGNKLMAEAMKNDKVRKILLAVAGLGGAAKIGSLFGGQ